ncbi:TetR/AcrR family transcriptional regulator [Acetobacter sp. AN02]|uniref:TetR/AcrR family transcriptional regulator n=1 Tax=Acetobacter sp. AN02 TaxID=2894186 RepID=UPI0024341E0B|nr:TetR/AcrR family transcriptional regulator [Acetobacter sp. AN02]MDG6094190.1 TetR/AcrR family transcriptional regulator [Acetobacter sp. AN02]
MVQTPSSERKHGECAASGRSQGPGRPLEMAEGERRGKILSAACKVLVEHGYHAASMNLVAQCCGMSKRTLYQLYPSKQELFHALFEEQLFRFSVRPCDKVCSPEEELSVILMNLTEFLLRPDRVCLMRAIVSESSRTREPGQILLRLERGGQTNILVHWLKKYCTQHGHPDEDAGYLSRYIFGMTAGNFLLSGLSGTDDPSVSPESVRACIRRAVRIFLVGLREDWGSGEG